MLLIAWYVLITRLVGQGSVDNAFVYSPHNCYFKCMNRKKTLILGPSFAVLLLPIWLDCSMPETRLMQKPCHCNYQIQDFTEDKSSREQIKSRQNTLT